MGRKTKNAWPEEGITENGSSIDDMTCYTRGALRYMSSSGEITNELENFPEQKNSTHMKNINKSHNFRLRVCFSLICV